MSRKIAPIPTRFNGHHFRSRLEARWAVFYSELGLSYEYEPQGYDLGPDVGPYLPDFYIPKQSGFRGGYIEIKPGEPTHDERRKCEALAEGLGADVYLFHRSIEIPDYWTSPEANPAILFLGTGGWDDDHYWCACFRCSAVGIEYQGYSERLACGCMAKTGEAWPSERYVGTDMPNLVDAFAAARGERFDVAS
jgi:hypothetical protein